MAKKDVVKLNNEATVFKRLGPTGVIGLGDILDATQTPWDQSIAAILPSATISTFGAAALLVPDAAFDKLMPTGIRFTVNPIGSETVTVEFIANYSDGTASSVLDKTATTTTPVDLSTPDFVALTKSGVHINSVSVKVKSSIGSSTASVAIAAFGEEYGVLK
jgi:hypothetical protein